MKRIPDEHLAEPLRNVDVDGLPDRWRWTLELADLVEYFLGEAEVLSLDWVNVGEFDVVPVKDEGIRYRVQHNHDAEAAHEFSLIKVVGGHNYRRLGRFSVDEWDDSSMSSLAVALARFFEYHHESP